MPRINLKKIEIKRTNGPNPYNRFGVILKHMPRIIRHLMVRSRHIKEWSDDDQFLKCVFAMQAPSTRDAKDRRFYYDFASGEIAKLDEIKEANSYIDWICAISMKPIKAKFMNFDLENFIHPDYYDVLDAPMVDSRILKSSIEFRKKCKKLLLEERQEFLKLAKRNAKKSID